MDAYQSWKFTINNKNQNSTIITDIQYIFVFTLLSSCILNDDPTMVSMSLITIQTYHRFKNSIWSDHDNFLRKRFSKNLVVSCEIYMLQVIVICDYFVNINNKRTLVRKLTYAKHPHIGPKVLQLFKSPKTIISAKISRAKQKVYMICNSLW